MKKLLYLSTGFGDSVYKSQVLPTIEAALDRGYDVYHLGIESPRRKKTAEWYRRENHLKSLGIHSETMDKLPDLWKGLLMLNRKRFLSVLKRYPKALIHARGHLNAWLAAQSGWPFVADFRGDVGAERELVKPWWFPAPGLRKLFRQMEKEILEKACAVSCVSKKLAEKIGADAVVIPTLVKEKHFAFSQEAREYLRQQLGFSNSDLVGIFVAGGDQWQDLDGHLSWMSRVAEKTPEARFIVLTKHGSRVSRALEDFPSLSFRTTVCGVPYEDVGRWMSAADFGLLLRRQSEVNEVAAPTKFSEYCCAGLPVCLTRGIGDTEEYLQRHAGIVFDSIKDIPSRSRLESLRDVDRNKLSAEALKVFGVSSRLGELLDLYDEC